MRKNLFTLCVLVLLFLCVACKPAYRGATESGFVTSGASRLNITVNQPLSIVSSGNFFAPIAVDMTTAPSKSYYSMYLTRDEKAVKNEAHIIYTEITSKLWRFAKESYGQHLSLGMSKETINNRFFTIQTYALASQGDWISDTYAENGILIPQVWLARRWSVTPISRERIIAEYREPLPACLEQRPDFFESLASGMSLDSIARQDYWGNCQNELNDFIKRANTAFSFEPSSDTPPVAAQASQFALPSGKPDLTTLVGPLERIEWDDPNRQW